ncbi:type II toxin-antitoxin system RelE/ParE family toxin [Amphiplicatus metriothermophilus]|uniref:Addiction module toxin, RelE/StbE family n=1 Tax=Amphiplicatus metriothermophilus TaxID=1519374 RepID=A0A239PQ28_9PROT|nr:type II toxin-antitoxin system RelE/ParE family toxin [Amphiplicatus metriothermophilus]MBB5518831.1 toxin ParE1/3/4 [Amphiplicatus metriothermophilus]SNT72016.1 addiction module toxin, RelE/StbE family [Amphiplicatus metriothermophilus]
MRVRFTRPALADLEEAFAFIAERNPQAAADVIDAVEGAVAALARHPRLGRPGRVKGTRELVVAGAPFVAAYRITGETVDILAVIHAARRWPDRFGEG